jgi:ribosomal subunit interface protein
MSLRVSGKNMDIGEALRTYVRARMDSVISKYSTGKAIGHITVEPEGSGYRTDCTLHLDSGITLQVEAEAHEPYASFNRAADRIDKRLRRYKRRLRGHHGVGIGKDSDLDNVLIDNALDGAESLEVAELQELHPIVIAESSSSLKEMSVSNAALELDMTNSLVVVFRHAGDGHTNIVYRRADGNIGWIDPQAGSKNHSS